MRLNLILFVAALVPPAANAGKPNILVILADDLGYGIVNAYNGESKRVATPNIDRLAKDWAKFTDA